MRLFVVAVVCFVFSTRRRREQCRYAARDVTRLVGSLLQTMLSPSMTGASAEATLWLVIVAVGGFMFTTRWRRLLALPTRRILRDETRQPGAASRASRHR